MTKEEKKEYKRQWAERNKERLQAKRKQYYLEHKDSIKKRVKNYRETHSEWKREYDKQYRESHKEERKLYCEKNKERANTLRRDRYQNSRLERATHLLCAYRRDDKDRGGCSLTAQWIVDNIFTSHCLYCGEEDWHLLGCDRKNNSKPHTPENVVPCCWKCNSKRKNKDIITFALSIGAVESECLTIKK